jgi:histone H3/H4
MEETPPLVQQQQQASALTALRSALRSGGVELRDQDRFLPLHNISKLIKEASPPGSKTTRESRELIKEAASEFISFITRSGSISCIFFNFL